MCEFNACFISYRHPDDPNANKFVRVFVDMLRTQLQYILPNSRIFFDEIGLGVGDKLDKLAFQLCRSACLVICYAPRHFDRTHPYCTMEYLAMRELEERRLSQTQGHLRDCGLIFPVVFRGENTLPDEIKSQRIYEVFDNVIAPAAFRTGERLAKIDKLARNIYDRWDQLERAGVLLNHDCSKFHFCNRTDVQSWLDKNISKTPPTMPGR
jgi:hypothetical protein